MEALGESSQCCLRQSWSRVSVQDFEFVSPGRPYRVYEGEVEGSVRVGEVVHGERCVCTSW